MKMIFSIIIVAHNEEKALARCLQSLKKQCGSRKNIEIIVVDDNSSDNTIKMAKKAGANVFPQKKSMGISFCRNLGTKKAKGKYVIFLDAHVYLTEKNSFKIIEDYFKAFPKVVGISGFYKSFRKNDYNFVRDLVREAYRQKKKKIVHISFSNFSTFSSCIGAIRKMVFKTYSFPEKYKDGANEDSLFQLILMNKGFQFLHLKQIQCWHDASLSFWDLLKKVFYQARGFNNLLHSVSNMRLRKMPFSPFLFDFPVSFLLLPFVPLKFFAVFFVLDFYQLLSILKIKGYSLPQKFLTVLYVILNEFVKVVYLPIYLVKKQYKSRQVLYLLKLFAFWEIRKIGFQKEIDL